MALGAMIARRGFDLDARKELEQLRENTTYSIQGGIPHSLRLLSEKPIQASRDSALLAQTLIWTSLWHATSHSRPYENGRLHEGPGHCQIRPEDFSEAKKKTRQCRKLVQIRV